MVGHNATETPNICRHNMPSLATLNGCYEALRSQTKGISLGWGKGARTRLSARSLAQRW